MATRVTSARFVGRVAELAELDAAFADAAGGRPSLAFVSGESGVGKSRLVGALAERARAEGGRVLSGDCVELGEGELPYAPLISALRPLVRAGDPAFDSLHAAQRGDLARLVPSLAGPAEDAPVEQGRVFEALLALLDALAGEKPVLLVIEDVHWADSSTRGFLGFLSRVLCHERLLVLATYRSDELHRRHPLRPLLAEIVRDPAVRVVELAHLTREEMAEQLEDILGEPPDPALVARLYGRSEGNPLFTEELLAAGLDGRGSLPPTLRDALMLRVERLPEAAQQVLRWLALQPAADDLLAELTGLDSEALRTGVREAVSSHIAVAAEDGSYAFRHALLREVVYDDLLPGERSERHAAVARALEARLQTDGQRAHPTAQVAHHWLAAGDQPAAFAASIRAAAAAERVNAFGEALALLERALGLWERVPEPEELAGCDLIDLLARAAAMADPAGDAVRQDAFLRRALDLIDEEAEPRRTAHLLERLARAQGHLNRQDEAVITIDRGLALVPEGEPSVERAALLAAHARARMLQSRFAEAAEAAQAALKAARALDDPLIEVRALNSLGIAQAGLGDFDAGTATLREALERAEPGWRGYERSTTYVNLADLLSLSGRAEEGLAVAREGLAQAPPRTGIADWLSLCALEMAYHSGRWDEAAQLLPPTGSRGAGTLLTLWRLSRSLLALGRGDLELARFDLDALRPAMAESSEVQFLGAYGWQRAELERRCGDIEAARAVVDDTLDRIEFCSEDMARIAAIAAKGVRVEADAAQLARDRRDPDAERTALQRADAMLERVRLAAEAGGPVERAERANAEAEHGRARGDTVPSASAAWAEAARSWLELGRHYPATHARFREAEALAAAGDRAGAADRAQLALQEARRLGSAWLAEEIESLAARARLRLEGEVAPASGDGAEAELPFGLTARELQVLALVAGGATNREIGSELHMAEKTASVHVSRILAKLDVRSRTEAAAVAHRHGLADQPAATSV